MSNRTRFATRYIDSWAVVVGINAYANTSPLDYATSDANAVATVLGPLGFPSDNITVLLDGDATRDSILSSLQSLRDKAGADDRVLFFFAGHGVTESGHRGDVGFLVPCDGVPANLHSLIRWEELTRIAELIPAKHAIFVMDACYGGLAVTRASGGKRFLKDVISRYVRQVLAAGKADQQVADSGGPRAGHSVFTGHLLDALEGSAANEEGIITANGAMAYVYDRVGRDTDSMQTPHYGCIDGDGDFVFLAPPLADLKDSDGHPVDILFEGPVDTMGLDVPIDEKDLTSAVKELLAEPSKRIKLDELVMREVKASLRRTGPDHFPLQGGTVTAEEFAQLLQDYESAARRVTLIMPYLGKWSGAENRSILRSAITRLADNNAAQGGSALRLGMRWYPTLLALYCGGIGAIAGDEYDNLKTLLYAQVRDPRTGGDSKAILAPTVDGLLDVQRTNAFKLLPEHKNHLVPCSEYLFNLLQPMLEDALFLGNDYEDCFDRLEVLMALTYAHLDTDDGHFWGPPGRFAWKYGRRGYGAFTDIVAEAKDAAGDWSPIRAGFFGGSVERFHALADKYSTLLKSNWL